MAGEGSDISRVLADLAKSSLSAGITEKAKAYAERLLNTSSTADSVHAGNQILGRIALNAGEIDKAGKYLVASGKTSGSPSLNSSGPSMLLAKELLEKGQKEAVLEFLDHCATYWNKGASNPEKLIRDWKAIIQAGGIPDFGLSALSR